MQHVDVGGGGWSGYIMATPIFEPTIEFRNNSPNGIQNVAASLQNVLQHPCVRHEFHRAHSVHGLDYARPL